MKFSWNGSFLENIKTTHGIVPTLKHLKIWQNTFYLFLVVAYFNVVSSFLLILVWFYKCYQIETFFDVRSIHNEHTITRFEKLFVSTMKQTPSLRVLVYQIALNSELNPLGRFCVMISWVNTYGRSFSSVGSWFARSEYRNHSIIWKRAVFTLLVAWDSFDGWHGEWLVCFALR